MVELKRLEAIKKVHPEMAKAYFLTLEKYSTNEFHEIVTQILQNDEKIPKIPDLIRMLGQRRGNYEMPVNVISFRCQKCETDFSVLKRDLERTGYVHCGYCKFYHKENIEWTTRELNEAADKSMLSNETIIWV